MIKCPGCKSDISGTAVMCYACGRKISEDDRALGLKEAEVEAAKVKPTSKPAAKVPAMPWKPEPEKKLTLQQIELLVERLRESEQKTELDPKNVDDWIDQGGILVELKKYEDAIYCYNRAIEHEPANMSAWSAKAYAFNKMGKQKEAMVCYKRAMEIGMARSTIDVDELLLVVDESKTYKEALDKAIDVISGPPVKELVKQCPKCKSSKITRQSKGWKCQKCSHVF